MVGGLVGAGLISVKDGGREDGDDDDEDDERRRRRLPPCEALSCASMASSHLAPGRASERTS